MSAKLVKIMPLGVDRPPTKNPTIPSQPECPFSCSFIELPSWRAAHQVSALSDDFYCLPDLIFLFFALTISVWPISNVWIAHKRGKKGIPECFHLAIPPYTRLPHSRRNTHKNVYEQKALASLCGCLFSVGCMAGYQNLIWTMAKN